MTEIPEEALTAAGQALADEAGLGNDCGFDAQWRRRTARFALTAALPHLRVQETPSVDRQTLALLLEDTVGTLDKGEEWYIADRILALCRIPAPRPFLDREALRGRVAMTLRGYGVGDDAPHPRYAREAIADAVLALLPTEEVAGGEEDPQRTDPAPTEDPEQAPHAGHRRVREPAQPADAEELAETRPTTGLTEEDTKALVETATRLGVELGKAEGRKQAGEEIAQALEDNHGWPTPAQKEALTFAAKVARNIAYPTQEAPSEPLTDPTGHSDLPEMLGGSKGPRRADATYPMDEPLTEAMQRALDRPAGTPTESADPLEREPKRCPECGELHVMGCPECGADLDMRDHYEGCIRIPRGEG